ncbi:ChrR family anti-sigma-E factor [Litorilituus lipolyticus]|uniref:Transcriptional regulator n=1 Tax=Litorilituus lipolyticus TaxID=2491017 RepID=A0A502KPA7_9GAMM|nr:ChrR family anti-sigma-E factor [Litorilituus lipolyticus]TPH12089.1 transcriptional regulator [Litorilituus lipolyticus]
MIKHHPTFELLKSFVDGELPASLSAGIAIHADMCPTCQHQIAQLTEQVAEANFEFEETFLDRFIVDEGEDIADMPAISFEQMIDNITSTDELVEPEVKTPKQVTFNEQSYVLPTALNNMQFSKTANIGKLSRARIQLDEDEIHTSLLHIAPGGGVPEHTHKGFELTLLLEGSFDDENGHYEKGDFIMLSGDHQHHPVSTEGCLCYTVANDALHFTQGINKLLNPIGSFIY